MNPIKFKESNKTLLAPKGMENCVDLHTHVLIGHPVITSCWGMTWRDRVRALFTGRIWLQVWTQAGTHEPMSVFTENPFPKLPKVGK